MADRKNKAPKNKTIRLTDAEAAELRRNLLILDAPVPADAILDRTICQDVFEAVPFLPAGFVDLMIVDPPYNLDKFFNGRRFARQSTADYAEWVDRWLGGLVRLLKPDASVYICADWRSSSAVQTVAERHLKVRNRITWEREKGRGARTNWKNCAEDVWFCTVSDQFTFDVEAVKLYRRVIAPYTDGERVPKDWQRTGAGDFRLTHPSNMWTDVTVPFWSMAENTDHPTQKPEKLIAKMILASSRQGDVVFDPFLGSGTTSVVARKLGRRYVGIEIEPAYCCLAEKRLTLAATDRTIQGYADGVFWERNTLPARGRGRE